MHLSFPNYQNWNISVLGHFFEISSLNEKYESIGLLDLLCLTTFLNINAESFKKKLIKASGYWKCYAIL